MVCSPYEVYRDVGVGFSVKGGVLNIKHRGKVKQRKIHSSILSKRSDKAKPRIQRIRALAKSFKVARKLYSGSGFSSSTWGHQATGYSKSEIINMENRGHIVLASIIKVGVGLLLYVSAMGPGATPMLEF